MWEAVTVPPDHGPHGVLMPVLRSSRLSDRRHDLSPVEGLKLWFRAIELVRASGNQLTARRFEREIGVSNKTAVRMLRQIRLLLDQDADPLASGDAVGASGIRVAEGLFRCSNDKGGWE